MQLTSFTDGSGAEVRPGQQGAPEGATSLILDLRENGGGLLDEAVNVASIFIPDGTIVSTDGRSQPRQVYVAKGGAISTSIPMVVLVDRGTASAAEIVTGALQDRHRAKVVGTHTYGKGVFQEIQPLPNGGALDITVGEYFTPSGRNLGGGGVREGAGIKPNVYALDNPHTARDEALNVAERTVAAQQPVTVPGRPPARPVARASPCSSAGASSSWPSRSSAPGRGWWSRRDRHANVGDLVVSARRSATIAAGRAGRRSSPAAGTP